VEIIQISSSVSGLIVWAAIAFAYLRYYIWYALSLIFSVRYDPRTDFNRLKRCNQHLIDDYRQFKRGTNSYKPYTVLAFAQPLPSIVAVAGCLVVLVFCSATWWDHKVTFSKVAIGYAAPIILLVLFIVFKIINRRLWVRTSSDFTVLSQTLYKLKWYKPDEEDMSPRYKREEATRVLSPPQVALPQDGTALELIEMPRNT
jgi:amino acid transporter